MNICLVLISDGWGGAETVVYELARHIRDKGENVSIILNQEMLKYYADLESVKFFNIGPLYPPKSIIPIKERTSQKHNLSHRVLSLLYFYLDELLRYHHYKIVQNKVMQFLSDTHTDVVHAHMAEASFLVYNLEDLKIPTIMTSHGEYMLAGTIPVHLLMSPVIKWKTRKFKKALTKTNKITDVSIYMLNTYGKKLCIPLKDRSVVIPNGVNISDVQDSLGSTLKLKGEFNLLFPGGPKWAKGVDLVVTSLAKVKQQIPDIHLYITRNVPQNHLLRKVVTNLELEQNVTFSGFLPIQKYRSLLNSVDLLVMPSREEAFGIVYLEAMALGKPIVAANTGGIPEVVKDDRNGILVEPEPDQIAEAILQLYKDENMLHQICHNNLLDVAKFDWRLITDQYIELYREIIQVNR